MIIARHSFCTVWTTKETLKSYSSHVQKYKKTFILVTMKGQVDVKKVT